MAGSHLCRPVAAAHSNKANIVWDDDTDNPVLRYKSGPDAHEVWFLDAVSALVDQVTFDEALQNNGPSGVRFNRHSGRLARRYSKQLDP